MLYYLVNAKTAAPLKLTKPPVPRVFKSKTFVRDARKAVIKDAQLCDAVDELNMRQGDDLGGNVWKKRLNRNMHRAIAILAPRRFWLFVYLFAKKDRENIEDDELAAFKKLAKDVNKADDSSLTKFVKNGDFVEICNESDQGQGAAKETKERRI